MIERSDIAGLVLAGGRGSRMGGADKGLVPHLGQPLALHALRRLAPQVGTVAINANRNLARYEAFGVPVWPDDTAERPGPLAGFLTGLTRAATDWIVTLPCDTPNFPTDLVARLAAAADAADARIAIPCTLEDGAQRAQPVFCLMHASLRERLLRYLQGGGRQVERWTASEGAVQVPFDEAAAFFNANTADELLALQRHAA